jgi:hypothetical protein
LSIRISIEDLLELEHVLAAHADAKIPEKGIDRGSALAITDYHD